MPGAVDWVLVWDRDHGARIAMWLGPDAICFKDAWVANDEGAVIHPNRIKHWMPLPEGPV